MVWRGASGCHFLNYLGTRSSVLLYGNSSWGAWACPLLGQKGRLQFYFVCVCVCVMAWLKRCSVLSLSLRWGTSTGWKYLRSHKHSRAIGFCFCFCFSFMSIPFRVQCLPLGRFAWSTLLLITVSFQCAWISCEMVSLGIPRYRGSQGEPRKDSALQK